MGRSSTTWKKGEGGRPKGVKNKKTRQWDAIGDYISNEGAERFLQIMEESNDKEYIDKMLAILNYFKPRLASTTNKNENTNIEVKKTITDSRNENKS